MDRKGKAVVIILVLFLVAYTIFPWIGPGYTHNLVLTVRFSAGIVPTYDVLLQNMAIWPVTLTDAQWRVTHSGLFNYWVPSEAPIQNLTLLPYQSHSFQFKIYQGTATTVDQYFNGTLTVNLNATISVLGAPSQVHVVSAYNATSQS